MPRHPARAYLNRIVTLVRIAIAEPRQAGQEILEIAAARRERRRLHDETPHNQAAENWERRLHELIGAPWPCADADAFGAIWPAVVETMEQHNLRVGRANFGFYDDADPGLARTLWCLIHHLQPANVVETGVAHGVSSRVMLEALSRTGHGQLSSIDMTLSLMSELRSDVGVAVPERLRDHWVFLDGPSRRHLRPLLRRLGTVDLFVHDSFHSTRNVQWELETAWSALRPGGVVLADDVDINWGFELFLQEHGLQPLYCMSDDGKRLFGLVRKGPA
jgi:hypothetical protein